MVISQQTNMVKVVNMVACKDLNNGVQTPANQGLPSWNSVGKLGCTLITFYCICSVCACVQMLLGAYCICYMIRARLLCADPSLGAEDGRSHGCVLVSATGHDLRLGVDEDLHVHLVQRNAAGGDES
jgi:hypothetical protein